MTVGDDLLPWEDMLTDTVVVTTSSTTDSYGNVTTTTSESIGARIISRSLDGGSETPSDRSQPNLWRCTVVTEPIEPAPGNGDSIILNGEVWEIDSLVVHEDHSGKAYEITCHNIDTGVQP